MNFKEYQQESYHYKKYADAIYPIIALGEECGEVQGLVAKAIRKQNNMYSVEKVKVMDELGDVLWNLSAICTEYGLNLEDVARYNLGKLGHREDTGQIVERTNEA